MEEAYRIDTRPKRGGWAPGEYHGTCTHCQEFFIGDKRASSCADCAYGGATAFPEIDDKAIEDHADREVPGDRELLGIDELAVCINESLAKEIYSSIEDGVEYAQEVLYNHDASLGRTTRKNKRCAEVIEGDIEKGKSTLKRLRDDFPFTFTP